MSRVTPTRCLSIYDLIIQEPGNARFHALTQPSVVIAQPPRFFFGGFPETVAQHFFHTYSLGSAGTFWVRGVRFEAAYVISKNSAALVCSELNIHPGHVASEMATVDREERPIRKIGGCPAFFLGPGYHIFGHWVVDFLPKLQVLAVSGHDIFNLSYLIPQSTPRWGLELLGLIGIGPHQLILFDPTKELLEVEEVLLPTFLHNGIRFSPIFERAAAFLKKSMLGGINAVIPSAPHHRIYISRTAGSTNRPLLNRAMVEKIVEEYDFQICHPEQLPLAEQINLFASASAIFGEYGSAHHMSIFAPHGTVVCGLRGSIFHPGFIQSGIGQALGQPTGYLFGQTDESNEHGCFLIAEPMLRDCIETIFKGRHYR